MRTIALGFALLALTAGTALAAVEHGAGVWSATYVAAYTPTFGNSRVPFHGILKLNFNNGIVSGTYRSDSSRPDPLRGRTIAVQGNTSGGNITLDFRGTSGGFTVRGTIGANREISGTATIAGRFYSFLAKVKSSP